MGPPGNRGSWGPCVLTHTQKKTLKRYQGHFMGSPTDPGPWAVPEFSNGQSAPGGDDTTSPSQGRTDNSWGPRAIGIMGPCVLAQTQKSL
ncbi:unnamed protein product [Staurois parvus]|uniref:Uncharacterized protein n=1 Tax=Staurois parvus TaxID=386267 RepID=A0ABN9GEA0_9NEOB|nr:unnamed protein product [Staurois parvus]